MNAPTLDSRDEALARRIAELVVEFRRPVLSPAEALAYTGHKSESAFGRWRIRWGVPPCEGGRYSRRQLDLALDREAKSGRKWTMKRMARPPAGRAPDGRGTEIDAKR